MIRFIVGLFQKTSFPCVTVAANSADKPEDRGGWVCRVFLFRAMRWYDVKNAENKVANEMVKTYRKLVKLNQEYDSAVANRQAIIGQAMSDVHMPVGRSSPYMVEGKTWPLVHPVESKPDEKEFKSIRELLANKRAKGPQALRVEGFMKGSSSGNKGRSETLVNPQHKALVESLTGERVTPADIPNDYAKPNPTGQHNQPNNQQPGGKHGNRGELSDFRPPE